MIRSKVYLYKHASASGLGAVKWTVWAWFGEAWTCGGRCELPKGRHGVPVEHFMLKYEQEPRVQRPGV